MSRHLDRFDAWAAGRVRWAHRAGLDRWFWGGTFALLVLWPVALDSGFVPETPWLRWSVYTLFILALVTNVMLDRHRNTATLERLTSGLGRANASLAGALESLARRLDPGGGTSRATLNEDECRELCIAFLARIRSLTYLALGLTEDDARLRVTLAVPLTDGGARPNLRVWCYDQPYDDRRFTTLDAAWPGAPEAYHRRAVAVIDDLRALPIPTSQGRRFRSVLCFPIRASHDDHPPLGVVSIDAEPVAYFSVERADRLGTYLQPAIQAIGLALISRRRNAAFTFA